MAFLVYLRNLSFMASKQNKAIHDVSRMPNFLLPIARPRAPPLGATHALAIYFCYPSPLRGPSRATPCVTGAVVSCFPPTAVYFAIVCDFPANLPHPIESRGLLSYQRTQQRKTIFLFFFFFSQSPTSMTIWRNYYYPHGQQWQHTTWQVSAHGLSGASFSS